MGSSPSKSSCDLSTTPTNGGGCPPGFTYEFTCSSSWIFFTKVSDIHCELDNDAGTQFEQDWPLAWQEGEYDAPLTQGSRYTVVGECSGDTCAWEDKRDEAPACMEGDEEVSERTARRASCCAMGEQIAASQGPFVSGVPATMFACAPSQTCPPFYPIPPSQVSTRESCCGSHFFGTAGNTGGKQIRTCAGKSAGYLNNVISVQKRGANCPAGSGMSWSFAPEYSCFFEEKGLSASAAERVVDCWIPYVVNSNNDCIAFDPVGAGWLRTFSTDGSELDGQSGRGWPRIEYGSEGQIPVFGDGGGSSVASRSSPAVGPSASQKATTAGAVMIAPAAVLGAVFFKRRQKRAAGRGGVEMRPAAGGSTV